MSDNMNDMIQVNDVNDLDELRQVFETQKQAALAKYSEMADKMSAETDKMSAEADELSASVDEKSAWVTSADSIATLEKARQLVERIRQCVEDLRQRVEQVRSMIAAVSTHAVPTEPLDMYVEAEAMRQWTAACDLPEPERSEELKRIRKGHELQAAFRDHSPIDPEVIVLMLRQMADELSAKHPEAYGPIGALNTLAEDQAFLQMASQSGKGAAIFHLWTVENAVQGLIAKADCSFCMATAEHLEFISVETQGDAKQIMTLARLCSRCMELPVAEKHRKFFDSFAADCDEDRDDDGD